MTITQIQCFCAVVKYGSFSQAAEMLFMSQSAVSKQVSALETECGFPLIIRNRKQGEINLSIEGQLMLRDCNKVLTDYEQLIHLRNEMQKKPVASTIGFSLIGIPEMAHYGIVSSIDRFSGDYPDTSIHLLESDEISAQLAVLNKEADLAFTTDISLDLLQFCYQNYCKETLSVVVSNDSPLAGKEKVSMSELAGYQLIVGPKKTNLFDFCLNACQNFGFEPKFAFLTSRLSIALDYIKNHPEVVFVTPSRPLDALCLDAASFTVIQPVNSPSFHCSIIWKRGRTLNERIQQYLRLVAQPAGEEFVNNYQRNQFQLIE